MNKKNAETEPPPNNPVAELLQKRGITKVAIIDDVFDPPDTNIFLDKREQFWEEISGTQEAIQELKSFGFEVDSADGINIKIINALWDHCEDLTHLKQPCRDILFQETISGYEIVDSLYTTLKDDLGLDVETFGQDGKVENKDNKIIFLDYYLGPVLADSIKKAEKKAEEIYNIFDKGEDKPLIILMSSDTGVANRQNEFRDNAGLLGGMFYFLPKNDFIKKDKLMIKIGAFTKALASGNTIHHFVESLQQGLNETVADFANDYRKLTVPDYAYIQKMALQDEGHPLGDYMLWLYKEYFMHLLDTKMKPELTTVNGLQFTEIPPSHFSPSPKLTKIFGPALFDFQLTENQLNLGDIYINNLDIRMIINAECDLAQSFGIGERKIDPNLSILLVHGILLKHTEKIPKSPNKLMVTEFFNHPGQNDDPYRILWKLSQVTTIAYKNFSTMEAENGFKKACRLKLPFALEVQNAFVSNLSRVGTPVSPPINYPLQVELFCEGDGGKPERLTDLRSECAFLFFRDGKDHCVFSEEFMCDFKEGVEKAIKKLDELIEKNDQEDHNNKILLQKKSKLERLSNDHTLILDTCESIPIPKIDSTKDYKSIHITRGRSNIENNPFNFSKGALLLNFIDI